MLSVTQRELKHEHITVHGDHTQIITQLHLYSDKKEKIFLEVIPVRVPENGDIMWEDWNFYDSLMIFQTDYNKLIVPYLNAIFPVKDPDDGEIQEYFDVCSLNWLGTADCERLIDIIKSDMEKYADDEKAFLNEFIRFLQHCLTISNIVLIEGNL
ncbi:MAG: hypothetical protein Q4E74_00890 [Ruminococcus sp.]|nr:hypothetical protein [Ruminococcus sp.]